MQLVLRQLLDLEWALSSSSATSSFSRILKVAEDSWEWELDRECFPELLERSVQ